MLTEIRLSAGDEMTDQREPLDPTELVIVFIGASAVGKSALAEGLTELGIVQATPTWATRPPRPGEKDTCYDHHFVTDEEFDRHSSQGGFIDEHALYGARYGIPRLLKPPEGKEALVVLKPVFMPVFIKHYPYARIHHIEASRAILPGRMLARGQSKKDIEERMRQHEAETVTAQHFADITINNDGLLAETLEAEKRQIREDRKNHDLLIASRA